MCKPIHQHRPRLVSSIFSYLIMAQMLGPQINSYPNLVCVSGNPVYYPPRHTKMSYRQQQKQARSGKR